MKKLILTTGLMALVAASSFGQGTVVLHTAAAKNVVDSATDGTAASLVGVPTTGVVGSFGTVIYGFLSAPSTTPLLTSASQFFSNGQGIVPAGWTLTIAPGPVTYTAPGAANQTAAITLPASSAANGGNVDLEIVAFTGTFANPTLFGYSGNPLLAGDTQTGLLSWVQSTGNPNSTPAGTAATLSTGTAGLGSIILMPVGTVPEPSTIALGGLAAATLLAFRRKK